MIELPYKLRSIWVSHSPLYFQSLIKRTFEFRSIFIVNYSFRQIAKFKSSLCVNLPFLVFIVKNTSQSVQQTLKHPSLIKIVLWINNGFFTWKLVFLQDLIYWEGTKNLILIWIQANSLNRVLRNWAINFYFFIVPVNDWVSNCSFFFFIDFKHAFLRLFIFDSLLGFLLLTQVLKTKECRIDSEGVIRVI